SRSGAAAPHSMSSAPDDHIARFLALLTHELRNPLGAITGYEELLADGVFGTLDEHGIAALLRIRGAADQVLALPDGVNELFAPGKTLQPELQNVQLSEVLQRALDDAQALI